MDECDESGAQLWKLLVGGHDHFLSPMMLSRVADFRDQGSTASLFAAAMKARSKAGVLKDESLALQLIDRLRIGVGWRKDLEDLNVSFLNDFADLEFLEEGISSTTLLMGLLECFDPSEVYIRCAILRMAARCGIRVPVVTDAQRLNPNIATAAPTSVYIGGVAYAVPSTEHNRMVLLLSTPSVIESRRDATLQSLFPQDERLRDCLQDSLSKNTIELLVNTDLGEDSKTGSTGTCQLLISNGRWDHHFQHISMLAEASSAIVLCITKDDIADDNSSLCSDALQNLVANNGERLIILYDQGSSSQSSSSVKERVVIQGFRDEQFVSNWLPLPKNLAKPTPSTKRMFQNIRKAILHMVDNGPGPGQFGLPVHWLDLQGKLPSQDCQEWLKWINFAAVVRKELDDLKADRDASRGDVRYKIFPFSQAAHKAATRRNKRVSLLRSIGNADAVQSLVQIEDEERKDFLKAANTQIHRLFQIFLLNVMFPQSVYWFERELEVWKSTGAVANLHRELENTKKELGKAIEQHNDQELLKVKVEKLYAQLDSVDWSVSDFWREIRVVKGLRHRHLLSEHYDDMIQEKYSPIFIPKDNRDSMARSFLALFLRGMTVDVLDGNLLSVDEDFLCDVFTPSLYRDSISPLWGGNESYFIISMLGVQSTGKSTLLNNLFGCNMPVSVGRTTRGMNVSYVQVSLPNSSIKHIIVQDYEGLMTMDRNDSLFDKDVCLQALATSDLVFVNTSRVIDAPTQQLLQYAAFAFHDLGLERYRNLKPKLAFILRDMVSSDTSQIAPAKQMMENALRKGFIQAIRRGSGGVLSDVMEPPEYIALASAVHRREPVWEQSLLSLRQFIFRAMTELRQEALRGRSFNEWVVSSVATWDCIRSNTGLLCAKTVAELRLKNQMEKALHTALTSPETIMKSEAKIIGIIDSVLDKEKSLLDEEAQPRFMKELQDEFNRCLLLVRKKFEAEVGGEETITETLRETWLDFRNHRIEKEVRRKEEHVRQKWVERFRFKHTNMKMRNAVEKLIEKMYNETPPSKMLNEEQATKCFEELLRPQEADLERFASEHMSTKQIEKEVTEIYVAVCLTKHDDQPNDFDDLVDMSKEDLTNIEDLTRGPMDTFAHRRRRSEHRHPVTTRMSHAFHHGQSRLSGIREVRPDHEKDVITDIRNNLSKVIPALSMSLSSLRNDIEVAVREINEIIERARQDLVSQKLDAWTTELAKRAHRHLYRNINGRVATLSREARDVLLGNFAERRDALKENYVATLTGKLGDRNLCGQIAEKLCAALRKALVNPAKLGLRTEDVPQLLHYFRHISSPEKIEEFWYEDLFGGDNFDLLLDHIKNHTSTIEDKWSHLYEAGVKDLRNSRNVQVIDIFSEPDGMFEKLKAATEEWFEANNGTTKMPIQNLLSKLYEQFEFLRDDDHLLILAICSMDEVNSSLIRQLWPKASEMISLASTDIDSCLSALRQPVKNLTYGCKAVCPLCKAKCKYLANHEVSHECHRHLVTGFRGVKYRSDREVERLSTMYCPGSAFDAHWRLPGISGEFVSLVELIDQYNRDQSPTWKIARSISKVPPREQREAFEKLNEEIATHFGVEKAIATDKDLWSDSLKVELDVDLSRTSKSSCTLL